jgi:type I restriction enzyme S subunit
MTVDHVRVGDVLTLARRAVQIDPLHTYELVGAYSFGKGLFRREAAAGAELGGYKFFALEPGDLVLSNIQAWEGAIALAGQEHAGLIGTHRFLTYIPRDDRIDASWARWFFLSEPGMTLIRRAAPGTAVRNRTLSMERFEALEIPLPPIDQQRRVAAELERLSGQQRRVATLCAEASRLNSALIGSLTQSGAVGVRLDELLIQVKREVKPAPEVEYALLGARWYGEGLFIRERKLGADSSASKLYRVQSQDFVYNRLFAWKGSFAVAGADVDGCHVSNEFPTFQVDEARLDVRYLHALFRNPAMWSYVEAKSTGGTPTSRNRFKETELGEVVIPLPSIDVQRAVVSRVEMVLNAARLRSARGTRVGALVASSINKVFPHQGE